MSHPGLTTEPRVALQLGHGGLVAEPGGPVARASRQATLAWSVSHLTTRNQSFTQNA